MLKFSSFVNLESRVIPKGSNAWSSSSCPHQGFVPVRLIVKLRTNFARLGLEERDLSKEKT